MAGRVRAVARATAGGLAQVVAALTVAFALGRAAWYPFWAASAPSVELARSWGGPSSVGATLAHWAVAALLIGAGALLFRLGSRWRRRARPGR